MIKLNIKAKKNNYIDMNLKLYYFIMNNIFLYYNRIKK